MRSLAEEIRAACDRVEREASERHSKETSEAEATAIELHRLGSFIAMGVNLLAAAIDRYDMHRRDAL